MTNLILAIDLSSTGAKVLYGNSREAMFPTVYHQQTVELDRALSVNDYPDLPDHCLIRFKQRTYLTGLGAHIYLRGAIGLRANKTDRAIPQILMAIADAAKKCCVERSSIILDLRCLLPAGEITIDRDRLQTELKAAAAKFYARNELHKCTIASFTCKPEGAGLYKQFFQLSPSPESSIGIVQLGYRNAGFFGLIDGTPVYYRSPQLGLSVLVREFQNTIGYPDEIELIAPISDAIESDDYSKLVNLINRPEKEVSTTLGKIRETYIKLLRNDMNEHMRFAETLIIGGGTAQTIKRYLSDCLPSNTKLSLHSGLGRAWTYPESLEPKLAQHLYYRFADIFCYSQYADVDNGRASQSK
jgi:hypothetical protein